MRFCHQLPAWDTAKCCKPCHEHQDQGNELLFMEKPDGVMWDICCTAIKHLDEMEITEEILKYNERKTPERM